MTSYADKANRGKPLHAMFTAVPPRYDLVNHIITWWMDKRWRRQAARECLSSKPARALDLCCGTGDLAMALARLADDSVEVSGVDFSQPMLDIAQQKAKAVAGGKKLSLVYGDVAHLPFPDGYFDSIGISFAFRNLTYKNPLTREYMVEVLRVLSDGGRFVIVESSQPKSRLVRKLFHLYLRWFVSWAGSRLSGNRGAYHYLAESAARFYDSEEVKKLLLAAGFCQVSFRPFFFGVVGIHVAVK